MGNVIGDVGRLSKGLKAEGWGYQVRLWRVGTPASLFAGHVNVSSAFPGAAHAPSRALQSILFKAGITQK